MYFRRGVNHIENRSYVKFVVYYVIILIGLFALCVFI